MLKLVAAAAAATTAAAQVLDLTVEPSGMFAVSLDGKPWLAGAETGVQGAMASTGDLVPVGAITAAGGVDILGAFTAKTIKWAKKGSTSVLMEASFKQYTADPAVIVFEQHFPTELSHEDAPLFADREHQWDVSVDPPVKLAPPAKPPSPGGPSAQTIFPGFSRHAAVQNCFHYDGTFPSMHACTLQTYKESHMGGFPLVQYDSM